MTPKVKIYREFCMRWTCCHCGELHREPDHTPSHQVRCWKCYTQSNVSEVHYDNGCVAKMEGMIRD